MIMIYNKTTKVYKITVWFFTKACLLLQVLGTQKCVTNSYMDCLLSMYVSLLNA